MNNGKILIVDDDPVIRDALNDILSNIGGYKTDIAEDGLDGINKIKSNEYDIIFTDVSMPKCNGIDLLKETKKYNPSIPIVVITGYSTIDNCLIAMKEGAYDFITKPFKFVKVISLAKKIIGERKLLDDIMIKDDNKASIDRLNTELFNRLREISVFQFLSTELDGLYINSDIYGKIVEMATRLVRVKEASFGILANGYHKIKSAVGTLKKDIPVHNTIFEKVIKIKNYYLAPFGEINPHNGDVLTKPFLSIPLMIKNDIFGILNLTDKVDGTSFSENEIRLALEFSTKVALRIENNTLYEVLYDNLVSILKSLIITIEARDSYTKQHSERVTAYSLQIAEIMGLSQDDIETIKFGGYLHDIGKIGVRDTILLKPDRLTYEEIEEIRLHTSIGDNIMNPLGFFQKEKPLIRNHHERVDGNGYPDGLAGEEIPLIVRIIATADSYDAMTSSRPYRAARSHDYAVEEMIRCSGSQFDRDVVQAFLNTPSMKSKRLGT